MRRLSNTKVITETQIFAYNSTEELENHFNQMQSEGWLGASIGTDHDKYMTTYSKRYLQLEDNEKV